MFRFHGNFYAVQVFTVNNITSTKYIHIRYVNLLNRYYVHKMCDVCTGEKERKKETVKESGAHSTST